jgi:hypothetical protein
VEPGRVERCRNRETGFMPNPHTIPGAPWPRAIHVLIVGLLAAVLLFMPAGPSLEAAKPAGLGLRLLESSDAADPFSPRNRDGRFDVNTLRVTLGVGPLGPPVRSEPAPGDDPGPIRHDPEKQGALARLHYALTSPVGTPILVTEIDLPLAAPLDIIYLPIGRRGVAPFARVSAEIPWNGRDAAGAFVADGEYPYVVDAVLLLDRPGRAGETGAVAAAGSVTVDNSAPQVDPVFPPAVSLTDAEQVTVRGRATDPGGVAVLSVNGLPVTRPGDLPGWSVVVNLARGENELRVASEDAVGNGVETLFARVRSQDALLCKPLDVAYDPLRDRALVADVDLHAVITVDLDSGERRVLSGAGAGAGPVLPRPSFIAMERARDRALVFGTWPDTSDEALVAVDPVSGDRSLISDPSVAGGPEIVVAWDAAIDEAYDRLLVCDRNGDALIGIDLTTGERSIVSGAARGDGPILGRPFSVAVDAARGLAFVTRSDPDRALLAVDLESGDRTLVATGSLSIPMFNWVIQELLIDPTSGRLLTTASFGPVTSFDPDSGDHVVVSGGGPELLAVRGMAFDDVRERLLLIDERHDALLAVNLTTGDRQAVSESSVGAGPPILFSTSHGLAVDAARGRLFYPEQASLWAVDLTTGVRAVVSSDERGGGPPLDRPADVEYDPASNGVYIVDWMSDAIYFVDTATGDRTVVSGSGVGSGAPLGSPKGLAVDSQGGRLLIEDGDCFILVRLDSGDRSMLAERGAGAIPDKTLHGAEWDPGSDCFLTTGCECAVLPGLLIGIDPISGHGDLISEAGTGPILSRPIELALDRPNHRALVVDRDIEGIIAVDLVSGDRTLVTGGGVGLGPPLIARAIEVDVARQVAFVSNTVRYELIAVDLVSGDRVIVAK